MSDPEKKETENEALKVAKDRLFSENERLKRQVEDLSSLLQKIKQENDEMQAFRDAEERGKLREDLRQIGCTYSAEEFDRMTLKELSTLKTHYTYFKPQFVSSSDVSGSRKSIYDSLDDVYTPLEERRRKMQEG